MTNSEQLFLVLCQELNFHRAAEKCYVSQQGLSDHIRRLEETYGTPLFQRRPRVQLTPAGEALRRMLERRSMMEQDLQREIDGLANGQAGRVTLGCSVTRARVFVPSILEKLWEMAPDIQVDIKIEDVVQMEQGLNKGTLDCFIGVDARRSEDHTCVTLRRESVFLVAPRRLLPPRLCPAAGGEIVTAGLEDFSDLPFVRSNPGSIINHKIDEQLEAKKIQLRQIASVSDYDIQLELCRRGHAAAICSGLVLEEYSAASLAKDDLVVFALDGLRDVMSIDLVWDNKRLYPPCVTRLLACIQSLNWTQRWGEGTTSR